MQVFIVAGFIETDGEDLIRTGLQAADSSFQVVWLGAEQRPEVGNLDATDSGGPAQQDSLELRGRGYGGVCRERFFQGFHDMEMEVDLYRCSRERPFIKLGRRRCNTCGHAHFHVLWTSQRDATGRPLRNLMP